MHRRNRFIPATRDLARKMYRKLPAWIRSRVYGTRVAFSGGGGDPYKQQLVLSYIRKHAVRSFIETGTYHGDMVDAVRKKVDRVYSIELDEFLYKACKTRFMLAHNVKILEGDSGRILKELMPRITEKSVFWLDGHYSGDGTARGLRETPIVSELKAIESHHLNQHVILVDDMRCFGKGDYPDVETVIEILKGINPAYRIRIDRDILRAEP